MLVTLSELSEVASFASKSAAQILLVSEIWRFFLWFFENYREMYAKKFTFGITNSDVGCCRALSEVTSMASKFDAQIL